MVFVQITPQQLLSHGKEVALTSAILQDTHFSAGCSACEGTFNLLSHRGSEGLCLLLQQVHGTGRNPSSEAEGVRGVLQ